MGRLAPALVQHSDDCHLLNGWMSQEGAIDFHRRNILLGGDLLVNRLGFGAMRLTGEGILGLAARSNSCIVSGLRCGWRYAGTNSIFTLRPSDLAARFNVANVTAYFVSRTSLLRSARPYRRCGSSGLKLYCFGKVITSSWSGSSLR